MPLTQDVFKPNLRVFRRLDVDRLSPEFIDYIGETEGSYEYVDANIGRDYGFTEEIMNTTVGAAIVDEQGNVIREYDGLDAWRLAEKAVAGARVTLGIEVDEPEADKSEADWADVPF